MPEDQTVEELREQLDTKREYLEELRADSQAAKDNAAEEILKAQLRQEMDNLDRQIDVEKAALKLQQSVNVGQAALGVTPESPPQIPEAPGDLPPSSQPNPEPTVPVEGEPVNNQPPGEGEKKKDKEGNV